MAYYPQNAANAAVVFEDTSLPDSVQYQVGTFRAGQLRRNALGESVRALNAMAVDGQHFWVLDKAGKARQYAVNDSSVQSVVNFKRTVGQGHLAVGRRWLLATLAKGANQSDLVFAKRNALDKHTQITISDRVLMIAANMDAFYVFGQDSLFVVDENAKAVKSVHAYPQSAVSTFGTYSLSQNGTVSAGFLGDNGDYFRVTYNPLTEVYDTRNVAAGSPEFVIRTRSPYFEAAYETELIGSIRYNADSTWAWQYSRALPRYLDVTEAPVVGVDFLRSIGYHSLQTDTANYLLVDDYKNAAPADTFRLPTTLRPLRVLPVGVVND